MDLFILALVLALLAAAAQHRPNAGDDLLGLKGLDHIVVGPQLQAQHLVEHLALGGEHDDGAGGLFPDLPAHLPAVQAGQHDVQQQQVRAEGVEHFQGRLAVIGDGRLIALFFDVKPQKLADIGIVIHNQDPSRCHGGTLPFQILIENRYELPILIYCTRNLWQKQEKAVKKL